MRERNGRALRAIAVAVLLLALLAAGWPGAVGGQGAQPQSQEAAQFLQMRVHNPDAVPRSLTEGSSAAAGPQALPWWSIVVVDTAGVSGGYVDLALDFAGRPHLSYLDNSIRSIKYASREGAAWQIQVVDFGSYNSLALDSTGRPHLSYHHDRDNCGLNYASYEGTTWQIEQVDPSVSGDVGWFNSLALDAAGRPHISYHAISATATFLKYAYYDGSAWHIETVDSGTHDQYVGWLTSIAVDSAGRPHISYCAGGALRYAWHDGSTWLIETVAAFGCDTSLVLDQAGYPHIAFVDYSAGNVRYAWYDGAAWHIQDITNPGEGGTFTSLALDPLGRPHVCYYSGFVHGVEYAWSDGLAWYRQVVDVGQGQLLYTSIALDAAGQPHIAYVLDDQIMYAVLQTDLAAWSRLAFASYRDMNWEVYAAQGDGTSPARLTSHSATDSRPEFNRGATQIAFDSSRRGNYDIYRMSADGSAQTQLTSSAFNEYQPAWSPDGSKIAYYGYPADPDNGEIYVMNADGSGQTRLTWDTDWDGHPTWSPDGARIAFVSNQSGAYELWTMQVDGTDQQQISCGLQYAAYPDWSPDGSRIALNDDFNGDGWFDLAVINADGTGLTHPLGASPEYYDALAPAWAPHGQAVAFADIEYVYYQGWYWNCAFIWVLDLTTGGQHLLTYSAYDWWPDWQSTDLGAPASQVLALPAWSGATFPVQWSGSDSGGAGLRSYDVQFRDGPDGPWTDWLLDTPQTGATFDGSDGHTYYFRCRARDYAYNVEPYPDAPETWTTVDVSPPSSAASSPPYALGLGFVVTWSGTDAGAGVASYDLQYRDGGGPWTDWLAEMDATAAFFAGQAGHTYYFQSRARDVLGNLEAYPGGNGDTQTRVPQYAPEGRVLGNREQPVLLALVESDPAALNAALSGPAGGFSLYYDISGTYSLSVTRGGFGPLPAMHGVAVPAVEEPVFYLPPLEERIVDGGFEAGDLAAWGVSGEVGVTLSGTAHTGEYAAAFGGTVPPPLVTPTLALSASAVLTAAGGVVSTSLAVLEVPAGAVSGTVVLTLTGVPTVTALPTGTQDIGLHVAWAAALTDGTPLTATLVPLTMTVRYSDAAWQAAQVAGEGTLRLWRYDPVSLTWAPLSGTPDVLSDTATVTTSAPALYALLGEPFGGPWQGQLAQEVVLTPPLVSGTLALVYRVTGAEAGSDTLALWLAGPTETVSYTLALTTSGWVHRWWEVPSWAGPTLTVRLEWAQRQRERPAGVVVDEVSLGPWTAGGWAVYLPLVVQGP